jgi:Cu(I)/Ag(I) efflux system membrane protein CusA/SilA
MIPLGNIAEITSSTGPIPSTEKMFLERLLFLPMYRRDLRGVVNDIQKTVNEKITLPEGYHMILEGSLKANKLHREPSYHFHFFNNGNISAVICSIP